MSGPKWNKVALERHWMLGVDVSFQWPRARTLEKLDGCVRSQELKERENLLSFKIF